MKPKAAIAAKKYVGVLAAPDAPGGRASRFITEIDAIGDVATTLTVDPGSEITVIDTDFLASLGEAVAQPAHSVAPTQIAGWNNTADGELHSACRRCSSAVVRRAAMGSDVCRSHRRLRARLIWGIDAAEQVGTVVTMSRLAPPRCMRGATRTVHYQLNDHETSSQKQTRLRNQFLSTFFLDK
jgi:hypothetical protein